MAWQRDVSGPAVADPAPLEPAAAGTAREVAYLELVLGAGGAGRRVVDLGCGTGERAIALARAGFEVTGLDASERALAAARRNAERAGVVVQWARTNPLLGDEWPAETAAVVVCMEWPAASPEPAQRRLLRRIHHGLASDGILVISHTLALAAGQVSSSFGGGANGAEVRRRRLLELEARGRSTAALVTLVRLSGFAVERVDGEHAAHAPANPASATVQLIARSLPVPPQALAVASWGTPPEVRLDLRYASDEAPLLDPAPAKIWERLVRAAGQGGAEVVAAYPTDDPYGGARGVAAVARFFGVSLAPEQLTFAAGVTSFLHDLAGLADGGPIAAPELVHPDLEAWAVSRGCAVRLLGGPPIQERLTAHLEATRPALLHFDRPDFLGHFLPLDELAELVRSAARLGATVVIDESPASYLGPSQSAVRLVDRLDNLVVLRGFTKAYSLGGMRSAFAVASLAVAARVRELVAPMLASELALLAAVALLAAGDVFARLRARVRAVKPEVVRLLRAAGLEVLDNDEQLPWVGLADQGGRASALLEGRGIRALRPVPAPVYPAPRLGVLRLTVPLSNERIALFRGLLQLAAMEDDHGQA